MPLETNSTLPDEAKAGGSAHTCCCTKAEGSAAAAVAYTGCRHKARTEKERHELIVRLNRIEGQIRGIRKMVESNVYCPDILIQVAAASAALSSFSKELLSTHIRTCVAQDIREGNDGSIDELLLVLQKLMK